MNDAIRDLEILERKWAMYVLQVMKSLGDPVFNSMYDYQCADEFLKSYHTPKAVETLVRLALHGDRVQVIYGYCYNCGMHAALTSTATNSVCVWGCPLPKKESLITKKTPDTDEHV